MEQLEHARLAPSSAGEFRYCPGSVQAQEPFPDEESEEAKEGTASHWVASSTLEAFKGGDGSLTTNSYIGQAAPNGIIITDEMAEGADEYVHNILQIMQRFGLLRALQVEQRVYAPRINVNCWGTPDAFAYDKVNGVIYIWDYKFGNRFVSVFENWQLLCYAAGILDTLKLDGQAEQYTKIVFRIVQPRCYQAESITREWSVMASDIRPYVNQLEMAANEALSENPKIQTGPHCRNCRARHGCDSAQLAAMAALEYNGALTGSINLLEPEALGIELQMLKRGMEMIKDRFEGLETYAISLDKSGRQVPGWSRKQGKGRKKWNKPVPEVLAMGALMKQNLQKPPEAITPIQAVKLGIDESVINAYSVTPNTSVKLVKDDGTQARHVFSQPKRIQKDG